jgi:uncharacterized protein (DUF2147 family)
MQPSGARSPLRHAAALHALVSTCLSAGASSAGEPLSDVVAEAAPQPGGELLGEWWTEGKEGRIRFTRQRDGSFAGTTTCCKAEKDVHNPDPRLRSRSTLGIVLIWGLRYQREGKYEDGYVYNPRDGETYRLDAKVLDRQTLQIRGYLGIPLLGQTQVWARAVTPPSAERR